MPENNNSSMARDIENLRLKFKNKMFANNARLDNLTRFNHHRLYDEDNEIFNKGLPVIFVTTPLINTSLSNIMSDGFFKYIEGTRPELLKSLSFLGEYSTNRPFITLLSNQFKSISLGSTQTTAKEANETFYGYKQNLPSTTVNSVAGGELNVTYKENKHIDVISLHKMWVDYTEHVSRGSMVPSRYARDNRIIDYTSSIYYFLLDFDNETIIFYSKYTGCVPSNVPYDIFSSEVAAPEIPDVSIDYLYSFKEDLDPDIIFDFNSVSTNASSYLNKTAVPMTPLGKSTRSKGAKKGLHMQDYYSQEEFSNRYPRIYTDTETGKMRLKYL